MSRQLQVYRFSDISLRQLGLSKIFSLLPNKKATLPRSRRIPFCYRKNFKDFIQAVRRHSECRKTYRLAMFKKITAPEGAVLKISYLALMMMARSAAVILIE